MNKTVIFLILFLIIVCGVLAVLLKTTNTFDGICKAIFNPTDDKSDNCTGGRKINDKGSCACPKKNTFFDGKKCVCIAGYKGENCTECDTESGYEKVNDKCLKKCDNNEERCNEVCYDSTEKKCIDNLICDNKHVYKKDNEDVCCSDDSCIICPSDKELVDNKKTYCDEKGYKQSCTNGTYCESAKACCEQKCDKNGCSKDNTCISNNLDSCCGKGKKGYLINEKTYGCCDEKSTYSIKGKNVCCDNGEVTIDNDSNNKLCCPSDRVYTRSDDKYCCAPGQQTIKNTCCPDGKTYTNDQGDKECCHVGKMCGGKQCCGPTESCDKDTETPSCYTDCGGKNCTKLLKKCSKPICFESISSESEFGSDCACDDGSCGWGALGYLPENISKLDGYLYTSSENDTASKGVNPKRIQDRVFEVFDIKDDNGKTLLAKSIVYDPTVNGKDPIPSNYKLSYKATANSDDVNCPQGNIIKKFDQYNLLKIESNGKEHTAHYIASEGSVNLKTLNETAETNKLDKNKKYIPCKTEKGKYTGLICPKLTIYNKNAKNVEKVCIDPYVRGSKSPEDDEFYYCGHLSEIKDPQQQNSYFDHEKFIYKSDCLKTDPASKANKTDKSQNYVDYLTKDQGYDWVKMGENDDSISGRYLKIPKQTYNCSKKENNCNVKKNTYFCNFDNKYTILCDKDSTTFSNSKNVCTLVRENSPVFPPINVVCTGWSSSFGHICIKSENWRDNRIAGGYPIKRYCDIISPINNKTYNQYGFIENDKKDGVVHVFFLLPASNWKANKTATICGIQFVKDSDVNKRDLYALSLDAFKYTDYVQGAIEADEWGNVLMSMMYSTAFYSTSTYNEIYNTEITFGSYQYGNGSDNQMHRSTHHIGDSNTDILNATKFFVCSDVNYRNLKNIAGNPYGKILQNFELFYIQIANWFGGGYVSVLTKGDNFPTNRPDIKEFKSYPSFKFWAIPYKENTVNLGYEEWKNINK